MPTAYTHDVQIGKISEFKDFALHCARHFGAAIMLRDEPHGPVPEKLPDEDNYHAKELNAAIQRKGELNRMTLEDANLAAQKEYEDLCERHESRKQEKAIHKKRYEAMFDKVLQWEPPTDDHKELKNFMLEQLETSIQFDCVFTLEEPSLLTGTDWLKQKKEENLANIKRHTEKKLEDQKRQERRQKWVDDLYASLATVERIDNE